MASDIIENTMVDNNVYITTSVNQTTCNGLIIKLTQWINALPIKNIVPSTKKSESEITDNGAKIITPYEEFPSDKPVLNVYISSGGGDNIPTNALLTLFHMASAKGAIIRTYVLSKAASAAGMIAAAGTKGYRFIAEDAYILIHFGNVSISINRENELETQNNYYTRHKQIMKNLFLKNSSLSEEEIQSFCNIEGSGLLDAKTCLKRKLSDWIITNDGRYINNVKDLKNKSR